MYVLRRGREVDASAASAPLEYEIVVTGQCGSPNLRARPLKYSRSARVYNVQAVDVRVDDDGHSCTVTQCVNGTAAQAATASDSALPPRDGIKNATRSRQKKRKRGTPRSLTPMCELEASQDEHALGERVHVVDREERPEPLRPCRAQKKATPRRLKRPGGR